MSSFFVYLIVGVIALLLGLALGFAVTSNNVVYVNTTNSSCSISSICYQGQSGTNGTNAYNVTIYQNVTEQDPNYFSNPTGFITNSSLTPYATQVMLNNNISSLNSVYCYSNGTNSSGVNCQTVSGMNYNNITMLNKSNTYLPNLVQNFSNGNLIGLSSLDFGANKVSIASTLTNAGTQIGNGASATGLSAIAIGTGTTASADAAQAIGNNAQATASSAFALGPFARATGVYAMALSLGAEASGRNSFALGAFSTALSDNAIAIGPYVDAESPYSIAIGATKNNGVFAYNDYAIAIGTDADVEGKYSTGIGYGVYTTADDEITFGTSDGAGNPKTQLDISNNLADFKSNNINTTGNITGNRYVNQIISVYTLIGMTGNTGCGNMNGTISGINWICKGCKDTSGASQTCSTTLVALNANCLCQEV